MTMLAFMVLGQGKPAVDPRIAKEWTAAVATGMERATLKLGADKHFALVSREKGAKADETIKGIFTVGPVPKKAAKAGMANAKLIELLFDLESMKKAGMPKNQINAFAKKGKTHLTGMRLYFVPDVPVLTDMLSVHFVPTKDKAAALKRLAKWKPI